MFRDLVASDDHKSRNDELRDSKNRQCGYVDLTIPKSVRNPFPTILYSSTTSKNSKKRFRIEMNRRRRLDGSEGRWELKSLLE